MMCRWWMSRVALETLPFAFWIRHEHLLFPHGFMARYFYSLARIPLMSRLWTSMAPCWAKGRNGRRNLATAIVMHSTSQKPTQFVALEISWLEADAECLPLENDSVDCYTISFGIRNCTNIPNVLNEAYRVLKPGGRFVCLEFSHVHDAALKRFGLWWSFYCLGLDACASCPHIRFRLCSLYDLFSFQVIPRMGQLIANDQESYQYLVESIRKFPVQPIFADMIRAPGFKHVEWEDFSAGIAAMHSGWKIWMARAGVFWNLLALGFYINFIWHFVGWAAAEFVVLANFVCKCECLCKFGASHFFPVARRSSRHTHWQVWSSCSLDDRYQPVDDKNSHPSGLSMFGGVGETIPARSGCTTSAHCDRSNFSVFWWKDGRILCPTRRGWVEQGGVGSVGML